MYLTSESIPRESKELIAVTVTRGTTEVTDFKLTLTPLSERPTTWTDPVTVGPNTGYLLPGTLQPDTYILWAQVDAAPELAVIQIRTLVIT